MIDFNQPYSRPKFQRFLEGFLPDDYKASNESVDLPFQTKYFNSITYLGETHSLNLAVYDVQHNSENDARIGLTREIFRLMAAYGKRRALVVLEPKSGSSYRFSLVTIDLAIDEKNRIKREYSNPKRYSFILGEKAKTHTPQKFLIVQGRVTNFDDLQKRFSVEVVNKEFYTQIAVMFSRLVGGKRKQGSRTMNYDHVLELPSTPYNGNEQKYKEFAVRLIGRTVFCWFLKKKKSVAGIPLIPEDVLSTFAISFNPNYYHSRVEPLFFNVLNTPVQERPVEYKEKPYNAIPFLNGGLFEPQPDDYYTNGQPNYALKIPDAWWKDFIDILETYNFTIDENTSIDIDLSVDPEMLGRIFENLLAEINPETGESARKSTGSYYTPRPIVEYMVDESLKQYLITKTGIDETHLETLLDYSIEESGLDTKQEDKVIEALNEIKVLDPACGSGAFPMGILQKMLLILQKVDHNAVNSIEQILADIKDPVYRKLIESKLKAAQVYDDEDLDDYARKLNIIRRSIYGVDIQPVAVDIAKLRFFLSIIVDEVIQDDLPNRGIEPLPNLEFKFVCANTLIPLPANRELFENIDAIEKLEELRDKYFISFGKEKLGIKNEFKKVQAQMFNTSIDLLSRDPGSHNTTPQTQTQMLATWNPFSNESTKWFDPKWMFGESKGFNLIIGNPPYRMIQPHNTPKQLIDFFKEDYKLVRFKIDLFHLFFIKGLQTLTKPGTLCFIAPSTLLQNTYVKDLRQYIVNKYFLNILAINSEKVFENADVHTAIYLINNEQKRTNHTRYSTDLFQILTKKEQYQKIAQETWTGLPNKEWNLLINNNNISIIKKLHSGSILMQEISSINRGLITGDKTEFFSTIKKSESYVKILAGGDILRYNSKSSTNFVKFERTKKAGGCWDPNVHFAPEKILIRQIGTAPTATLLKTPIAFTGNLFSIISNSYTHEFILAIINSKLISYYWKIMFSDFKNTFPQITISSLGSIPIKKCKSQKLFKLKVDALLDNYTQQLNNQLDLMILKLYELTYEEAIIVDPELPGIISKEDYEGASIEELAEWEV